jgi:hypothetical protein
MIYHSYVKIFKYHDIQILYLQIYIATELVCVWVDFSTFSSQLVTCNAGSDS